MLTRSQLALLFSAVVSPATVQAQPELLDGFGGPVDYGTECLSPNDDGSSAAIDLTAAFPGGLEFFGRRHTLGLRACQDAGSCQLWRVAGGGRHDGRRQ